MSANGKTTTDKVLAESMVDFDSLDAANQELIREAMKVRQFAYAPYSNFAVGAALLTKSGKIYTGCNVESGAFTAGVCAERSAICQAISHGDKEFVACAVAAYQKDSITTPCGPCRQLLNEFAHEDFPVYAAKAQDSPGQVLCTSIYNLLPHGFRNYF